MGDEQYTFYPWARSGFAGLVSASPDRYGRANLQVQLAVNGQDKVEKCLSLLGPGDVRGLHPGAVLRTEPSAGTRDFAPDYFPCVELNEPDLPWRFTPQPVSGDRLPPWLVLIVAPEAKVRLVTAAERGTFLSFTGTPLVQSLNNIEKEPAADVVWLPPLESAWALAHVQVLGECSALESVEKAHPERTVSRLLYPFRLHANTPMLACLVPTFAAGVLAGLETSPYSGTVKPLDWAWTSGRLPSCLPVYHHWRFATGQAGTFEQLVKRLQRTRLAQGSGVGCQPLDLSALVPGVPAFAGIDPLSDPPRHGPLEGVLTAPGLQPLYYQWDKTSRQRFEQALLDWMKAAPSSAPLEVTTATAVPAATSVPAASAATAPLQVCRREVRMVGGRREERNLEQDAQADDPVVAPPLYGGWQAGISTIDKDEWKRQHRDWLAPLNLEPGLRATAGLGVRTIQKHQEALMASAWEQLETLTGDIRAWQRSQQVRQVRALSRRTQRRHLDRRLRGLGILSLLQLTGRLHARLSASEGKGTFAQELVGSRLPSAVFSARFRRSTRPGGALLRRVLSSSVDGSSSGPALPYWLETFQTKQLPLLASPQEPEQAAGDDRDPVATLNDNVLNLLESLDADDGVLSAFKELRSRLSRSHPPTASAIPIAPTATLRQHLEAQLNPCRTLAEPPRDPMPCPHFTIPALELVREEAPWLLLPGGERLAAETLTVVEANGRFIEAFLAGLNHEFARELLWRGFPTDQRGSYFTHFWEGISESGAPTPDVLPLDRWQEPLGENASGTAASDRLVLLIRGELIRRFPNAVIYAVEAVWEGSKRALGSATKLPIFSGQLDADTVFFGFDLDYPTAYGSPRPDDKKPGWWFVLQEQPTELRFGDGTAWKNALTNGTAATAASAALDPPVLVAIHADDLLPPQKAT